MFSLREQQLPESKRRDIAYNIPTAFVMNGCKLFAVSQRPKLFFHHVSPSQTSASKIPIVLHPVASSPNNLRRTQPGGLNLNLFLLEFVHMFKQFPAIFLSESARYRTP